MKHPLKVGLLFLFLGQGFGFAAGAPTYAPKLSVGISNGFLSGSTTTSGVTGRTSTGSTLALGGLNLSLAYFLSPVLNVGLGYHADFDFAGNTLPISGFALMSRYYFSGLGTRVSSESTEINSSLHDPFAFFVGGDVAQRTLYVAGTQTSSSSTSTSTSIQSSFIQLNAAVGGGTTI